jgi:hypothetical protein
MAPIGEKVGIQVIPFNIQIMKKSASSDEEVLKSDE